jgi:hypothetical protein
MTRVDERLRLARADERPRPFVQRRKRAFRHRRRVGRVPVRFAHMSYRGAHCFREVPEVLPPGEAVLIADVQDGPHDTLGRRLEREANGFGNVVHEDRVRRHVTALDEHQSPFQQVLNRTHHDRRSERPIDHGDAQDDGLQAALHGVEHDAFGLCLALAVVHPFRGLTGVRSSTLPIASSPYTEMLPTCTKRRTPAASAASTILSVPSTLTAMRSASRHEVPTAAWTTASQP